jgi:hypothetical protein
MREIKKPKDLNELCAQGRAVIYFYVDWSVYAVRGREVMNAVEKQIPEIADSPQLVWWADVSDVDSPAGFIFEWLRKQERDDLKMCSMIAGGSGCVVWTEKGNVIDFETSAGGAGTSALVERTKTLFSINAK